MTTLQLDLRQTSILTTKVLLTSCQVSSEDQGVFLKHLLPTQTAQESLDLAASTEGLIHMVSGWAERALDRLKTIFKNYGDKISDFTTYAKGVSFPEAYKEFKIDFPYVHAIAIAATLTASVALLLGCSEFARVTTFSRVPNALAFLHSKLKPLVEKIVLPAFRMTVVMTSRSVKVIKIPHKLAFVQKAWTRVQANRVLSLMTAGLTMLGKAIKSFSTTLLFKVLSPLVKGGMAILDKSFDHLYVSTTAVSKSTRVLNKSLFFAYFSSIVGVATSILSVVFTFSNRVLHALHAAIIPKPVAPEMLV